MRTVLHDWPDSYCHKILTNVVSAMGAMSRLLINECVLAETGTPLFPAQLDISKMIMHASMERTRKQWEISLGASGLKVVKVHTPKEARQGSESLIEAIKKDVTVEWTLCLGSLETCLTKATRRKNRIDNGGVWEVAAECYGHAE